MQRRKVDPSTMRGGAAPASSSSSLPLHSSTSRTSTAPRSSRKSNRGAFGGIGGIGGIGGGNSSMTKKKSPIQVFVRVILLLIILMVTFTFVAIASHTHGDMQDLNVIRGGSGGGGGSFQGTNKADADADADADVDASLKSDYSSVVEPDSGIQNMSSSTSSHHVQQKRSSAEATAAMERQPSHNVDGEISLKAHLSPLYQLQQEGKELGSQIVTRWLGRSDLDYWFAKSKEETQSHEFRTWQDTIKEEREEMKVKDVALNPSLYNLADAVVDMHKEEEQNDKSHMDTRDAADGNADGNADADGNAGEGEGDNVVNDTQKSEIITFTNPAPPNTHVSLKPTFGKHRSHSDAIFAFAEGYELKIYLTFLESLKATGYNGDLVLSVSALDKLKPGVEEYLRSHHKEENEVGLNVVVYTVTWICYTGDGKQAEGANEGQRMCELVGMYKTEDGEDVKDPREPRPVATARYELYWAWSLQYDPNTWFMLIDSRDAFFQTDPFVSLERVKGDALEDGLLYFFGENADASNIGQSSFNSRWLKTAYGEDAVKPFFERPIVCSGSTMGEQIAIESYLRAMVEQFDKTKCKQKGCDQGFHNYLYYSDSLKSVHGIRDVVFFEQGKGIINNLGVLRKKPLKEWGLLDEEFHVLNWDKSLSPVAHQFDRDDELNQFVKGLRRKYEAKYKEEKNAIKSAA